MSRVRNKADFASRSGDFDGDNTDDVQFDNITVTGNINVTGTSSTIFTAGANIELDAASRVLVKDSPFTPARLSSAQRDAIVGALGGDIIYNTTTQVMEVYQNGQWVRFDSVGIIFPQGDLGDLTQDFQTLGFEIGTATNFDCEKTIVFAAEDLGPGLT